jgi:hypothetical protein
VVSHSFTACTVHIISLPRLLLQISTARKAVFVSIGPLHAKVEFLPAAKTLQAEGMGAMGDGNYHRDSCGFLMGSPYDWVVYISKYVGTC